MEVLAIIFGINKFNQFVRGQKFILLTDCKSLMAIFGPKKGLPAMAASRLQCCALILSGYNFEIKYFKSENYAVAVALSRFPLESEQKAITKTNSENFYKSMRLRKLIVSLLL